ncbi:precorrin-2 dehydrogenase/sirohydrochlorin ferrochelatase family protein [Bacillus sp. SJS]|uniref:precorrin-2 dehydrogenase/sirohydrochlorin ferrochelatase family protein n=1 Tax=Bacillus sp. SJS TaxID=1423321 RepID=UPI0004DD0CA9|nr:NAD(P)-dependent oxidoreductase [Bacillus sp. SJS]KZZ82905.1 hypothetical protein AS29_019095 [Bacillus sp. SJS]
MIPLMINFSEKPILIAGGGKIAYRRLMIFLKEEAAITVISPEAVSEIRDLHLSGEIQWIKRKIRKEDLDGYFLIIAATDDRLANKCIAEQTHPLQLVNIADEAKDGNVEVPMRASKGKLTVSVHTGGSSPAMAKEICSKLIGSIEDETFELLEQSYLVRQKRKTNQEI